MKFDTPVKYNLTAALYTFAVSFTKTTFIIYLLSNNLTKFDVHLVLMVFTLTTLSLEPVTAIYGEYFGRKNSFLLGCLIKSFAALLFYLGKNLYFYIFAEVLSAIGVTLITGCLAAWMVEKMKEQGRNKEICKVFESRERYKNISFIIGGLSGAYLGEISLALPWLAVSVTMILTIFLGAILIEDFGKSKRKKPSLSFSRILSAYSIIKKKPPLFFLFLSGGMISFALASPRIIWLPGLKNYFGDSVSMLGWAWVGIAVAHFLGSYFIRPAIKLFGGKLEAIIAAIAFSAVFLFNVNYFNGIACYIIFYFLFEFSEPIISACNQDLVNYFCENEGRVIILSLESLVSDAGNMVGLLIVGWISLKFGEKTAWYLSSFLFLISFVPVLLIKISYLRNFSYLKEYNNG